MRVIEEMDESKIDTELQLALTLSPAEREKSLDLDVGYDKAFREWELIVKYHGSLDVLGRLGVTVEYLIAGYALLTVPEGLVENIAELEEIEYVEKPKRFFYEAVDPAWDSCIQQLPSQGLSLSGAGILLAVLDSGERVTILSGQQEVGKIKESQRK